MATIQSLGLHEPSALPYLIAESILPHDPPTSSYRWEYQRTFSNGAYVTDEILIAANCVVWSRNGTVKRVFNLDIEEETILHAFTTTFTSLQEVHAKTTDRMPTRDVALVAILRSHAHIFLLSGDMHVLPLSFEVDRVLPCAHGFLLQRKLSSDVAAHGLHPTIYGVRKSTVLPRTYSFTSLLSELGLVVAGPSRKSETHQTYDLLPMDETLLYLSAENELQSLPNRSAEPVYLAVTANPRAATLTFWRVFYDQEFPDHKGTSKPERKSKRKSSNVYGRQVGAATPLSRAPINLRESFGGLAQSVVENTPFPSKHEQISKQTQDLASSLGHEFEQSGVQTRSARRVSSMLARTDLGAANDRSTFNDIAHGTTGRKSLSRSIRHGESLGGFSDRQSFGRRRSSFRAASSIISDGTSFLDIPASHLLEDGRSRLGVGTHDEEVVLDQSSQLPREVTMIKLHSASIVGLESKLCSRSGFKVTVLLAPDSSTADDKRNRKLSVCVMDRLAQEIVIVGFALKTPLVSPRSESRSCFYDLKAVETQRGTRILDVCRLSDGSIQRLLTLTKTRQGQNLLHLEAPWSTSYRAELPTQYKVFDPGSVMPPDRPDMRRDTGIHRVIALSEVDIKGFKNSESWDTILIVDQHERHHRLELKLGPENSLIRKILSIANFVMQPEQHDSLLVAWWEVKRWLAPQCDDLDIEWTSMVVSLFLLAVPFISSAHKKTFASPKKKKGGILRSSSGTTMDTDQWFRMLEAEKSSGVQDWTTSSSWNWATAEQPVKIETLSPKRHRRLDSREMTSGSNGNAFAVRCANFARDFLQSPAGELAIGPEGYLPTAMNKDLPTRRIALANIVVAIHLLREELKLDRISVTTSSTALSTLPVIIAQLAIWLDWNSWAPNHGTYYGAEISNVDHWLFERSLIDTLDIPKQPFEPPSIFGYIEACLRGTQNKRFPSILDCVSQSRNISSTHPLWTEATKLTPRLFVACTFFARHGSMKTPQAIIDAMVGCGVEHDILSSLPDGISAACQQAIIISRGSITNFRQPQARVLLDRDDTTRQLLLNDQRHSSVQPAYRHYSTRDVRSIGINAIEAEAHLRWDASSEFDRQAITRLLFDEDRRYQEASKLVNQTRPPVVECVPEPGWNESDLLDAQKELAQYVTRRTLSIPAGRGMMHYNARVPLLTERVAVPAFSLQCVMKSRDNSDSSPPMTFSADKALFTEDKTSWAFFHNGTSAGLMISRNAEWIDTSWILYNKPPELTNRHAGFLLALGLNGHLKSLAKWVAFKYLTPKHTMISVGLLLGLAASYIGTMDTLVTRLLSVHVTRLLPPGAAELNLSPLTQTTGLLGVGLVYFNSQHRRMSEIMLSEIENHEYEERSGDEPILRDEGYRLAAGFAIGLINLGHGHKLHGLHDMNVVDRLLAIAIGTKNVSHVHVLDRATAGAVIGIAFLFMKTNDKAIARKIDIPDTLHQFQYVRPDVFLLRTLARHLIMWDAIVATPDFVYQSLPKAYQRRADLSTTKRLNTDDLPFFNIVAGVCFALSLRFAGSRNHAARELLIVYLDQFLRLSRLPALSYDSKVTLNGVRNCLDVLALACATVMAGSGDILVMRRLRSLHGRVDKETPFGSHLAAHMALGALFLSGGTATFGTSNLAVASLVMAFYPVFPIDVLDNRGHLQALRHLWVLAVDHRCLVCRDIETGEVINGMAVSAIMKDSSQLTFRSPSLLPDFDDIRKIKVDHENYWNLELDLDSKDGKEELSAREKYRKAAKGVNIFLRRRGANERPNTDVFSAEIEALDEAHGIPSANPNHSINEKWRHNQYNRVSTGPREDPFSWIFALESLKHLDHAERALALGTAGNGLTGLTSGSGRKLLKTTNVDSRLDFELGTLGPEIDGRHVEGGDTNAAATASPKEEPKPSLPSSRSKKLPVRPLDRDKLWQLRLLFACADRWEQDEDREWEKDEEGEKRKQTWWINREVVDSLRERIWKMASE